MKKLVQKLNTEQLQKLTNYKKEKKAEAL